MHQGFRKELWTKLVEVLIIDEISMLSGEWLDNLERMLRELTHYYGRGEFQRYLRMPMKDIPAFGGIQVVVVGDFYQLPPIPATIHGETFQRLDHGLFHSQHIPKDSHTKKIYFTNRGYAFQSMAWRAAEFVYVHLRTCHRIGASERAFLCGNRPVSCHRADAATETHNLDFHTGEFVQLMGRIRRGEARDKDYDRLNKVGAKRHPDDAEPTEIWPTNAKVNAVNRQGLERLKDPPKRFEYAYEAVWKSTSASGASIRTRREILISTQGLGAPVQKHSALHLRGRGHARLEDVRLHQVQQAGRADRRPQAGRAHSTTEEHRHAERGEEGAAFGERHDGPHPAVGHG